MQWVLDNSGWLIGAVAVAHVLAFGWLWVNRNKQMRRLEAHLRNVVGGFATHTDVDPYTTIDERIDSFIADIREVIRDPARRDDQRRLYHRLVTKEESKKYLQGKTFETWYNVLRRSSRPTRSGASSARCWRSAGLHGRGGGAGGGQHDGGDRAELRRGDLVDRRRAGLRDRADAAQLGHGTVAAAAGRAPASVRDVIRAAKHELGVTLAADAPAGTAA
jgi:hypothetical protein